MRVASALCLLLCAACATTTSSSVLGPEPATLEVVNRASTDRRVAVDGQEVGTVPPGARRRFRGLRPGQHRVEAYTGSSERVVARVDMAAGGRAEWVVLPADPLTALEAPAPLGAITLVSTTDRDVEVRLDEGPWRTLRALEATPLPDVAPGLHVIDVRVPGTRYARAIPTTVTSNQDNTVKISVDTGIWKVVNLTGEPIRLRVDGVDAAASESGRRSIGEGDTLTLSLIEGVHTLLARGEVSGREYHRTVEVSPEVDGQWVVKAAGDLSGSPLSAVLIENRTKDTLTVTAVDRIASRPDQDRPVESVAVTLPPNERRLVDGLPAGVVRLHAKGNTLSHVADVATAGGQTTLWTIAEGQGTLRLVNRLSEPAEIDLGGGVIFVLAEDATSVATALPVGEHPFRVRGTDTGRVFGLSRTIAADVPAVAELTAPSAQLRVKSTLGEPVFVRVNGVPLGRVAPDAVSTLADLPVGDVHVIATMERSGAEVEARLHVAAGATAEWIVKAATATLWVTNRTSEALTAPPNLRDQAETVAPGARVGYVVGTGSRSMRFFGRKSGRLYVHDQLFLEGTDTEWAIEPQRGAITIYNRTLEAQHISIDGDYAVRVAPRAEATVEALAGPHQLSASGAESATALELSLLVRPEAATPWELLPSLAHVRVENRTFEPLTVEIDGAPLGQVSEGTVAAFGPWPPSTVALRARGNRSGALYRITLELHAGAVEPWIVLPARGIVAVDNRRAEALRVVILGKTAATLDALGRAELDLPVGPVTIELVGASSSAPFVFPVFIRPDRVLSLEAPEGPRALLVDNFTDVALDIAIEDHPLGQVAAASAASLGLSNRGRATLIARDPKSGRTWQRRLNTGESRVIRWEIRP